MSGFYRDIQSVAKDILGEFRQGEVILQQYTKGDGPEHNPGEPTFTPVTLDATVRGVMSKYVDETNILTSDLQVISAVVDGVVPKSSDKVTIDGTNYQIVEIIPNPASGTVIVYNLIVRK